MVSRVEDEVLARMPLALRTVWTKNAPAIPLNKGYPGHRAMCTATLDCALQGIQDGEKLQESRPGR